MACNTNCKACPQRIYSVSVRFAGGTLVIDIPNRLYMNGEKYCLILTQNVPAEATIDAPVVFTIGGVETTTYPLVDKYCAPIVTSQIKARKRYPLRVATTLTGANFKLMNDICSKANVLDYVPAPATPAAT